eukprot:TRINITY_DN3924_c0_g1_i1.p1 TRINITY_DN3924_c0_g1~~TRINITY_DN3924_c0_g1_i1.p1  ORF type:complete len:571 (-),score=115.35 TRINITY_DN3924_c0_g1_i1:57-1769(-)
MRQINSLPKKPAVTTTTSPGPNPGTTVSVAQIVSFSRPLGSSPLSPEDQKRLAEERQLRREQMKKLREEKKKLEDDEMKKKSASSPLSSPIKRTVATFSTRKRVESPQSKAPQKTEEEKKIDAKLFDDLLDDVDNIWVSKEKTNEVIDFFNENNWSDYGQKLVNQGFDFLEDIADEDLEAVGMTDDLIKKFRRALVNHLATVQVSESEESEEDSEEEDAKVLIDWALIENSPGKIAVEARPLWADDLDEYYVTSAIEAYGLVDGQTELQLPSNHSLISSVVTESGNIYFLTHKRDSAFTIRKVWEEKLALAEQEKVFKNDEMRQFFNECSELNSNLKVVLNQLSREPKCPQAYDSTVKVPECVKLLETVVPGTRKKPLETLVEILSQKSTKLGLLRHYLAQFVLDLISKGYKAIDNHLEKSGILKQFVLLFFAHSKCSVFHNSISQMIIAIFNSGNKPFIEHLMNYCNLLSLVLDSPKLSEYRPYLVNIAIVMDKRSKELPFLGQILRGNPRWQIFVKDEIGKKLQVEVQPHKPPTKRDSSPPIFRKGPDDVWEDDDSDDSEDVSDDEDV